MHYTRKDDGSSKPYVVVKVIYNIYIHTLLIRTRVTGFKITTIITTYIHILYTHEEINLIPAVHGTVAYLSIPHLVIAVHDAPIRMTPSILRCGWPHRCLTCSRVGRPSCCYSYYQKLYIQFRENCTSTI